MIAPTYSHLFDKKLDKVWGDKGTRFDAECTFENALNTDLGPQPIVPPPSVAPRRLFVSFAGRALWVHYLIHPCGRIERIDLDPADDIEGSPTPPSSGPVPLPPSASSQLRLAALLVR
jgi:hypothetical protein